MSNTTTFEYDLAGRKVKSVLPEVYDALSNTNQSPVEEYSYDTNGNLTATRDALGNLYNTVYDSRNRKIAEVSPAIKLADGSYARPIKQSVYDAVGNVIKAIDPNGNATDTVYDNANRAVSVTFPEVEVGGSGTSGGTLQRPQELRSYDKNSNVISATNPRGIVTETSYNCFNKPVLVVKNAGAASESDKITESLSYDANGNLEVITDGNGNKTKYVYDAMNRRTQAIYGYGSTTTRSDSFAYDALNLTNRKGVAITYDTRNRIQSEAVNKRVYSYDACGRILSVKDESGGSSGVSTDVYYSYDALGRLLSESNGGRTHFYQYDLANRRVKSFYGSTSSIFESSTFTHTLEYAYNTNGKISTITDQKGRVTSYTYDLNGNVVEKTHANGMSYTRSYDALNRRKDCNIGNN